MGFSGGVQTRYKKYPCKGSCKRNWYETICENIVSRYQTLVPSLSRGTTFWHGRRKAHFMTGRTGSPVTRPWPLMLCARYVKCHMFIQSQCKAIHFQDGDRYVCVLLLTLFLVFQFLSFISLAEKSQYTSRIKSLPLKSGECRYFDVSSLNEERYGTLIRLNVSLHVKVRTQSKQKCKLKVH